MSDGTARQRIPVEISPDVLDQIGRDFKFNHGKGVVEWLKNSLDAYLVRRAEGLETESGSWPVHLLLQDGRRGSPGPNLAVIDFAGATYQDVRDFLLQWFSTSAAARGARAQSARLTGGHGNGGKFYMREMWRGDARFCTFLDGRASSLVVDRATDGTCGYWEIEDEQMDWRDAMRHALNGSGVSLDHTLEVIARTDEAVLRELDSGMRGFTVVLGRQAVQVRSSNDVVAGGRWRLQELLDSVRAVPAAHRPLSELNVRVTHNGHVGLERLHLERVEEDPNWQPEVHALPLELPDPDDPSHRTLLTSAALYEAGRLTVRKATTPLVGRLRARNQITVFDPAGNPVGSFSVAELNAGSSDHTRFFFGELEAFFDDIEEHVENDRESFRNTPQVQAIKAWLSDCIGTYSKRIDEQLRSENRARQLEAAAALNRTLNEYARSFLHQLETDVFVDWTDEEGGGEGGDRGEGEGGHGGGGGGGGSREGVGRRDQPGSTDRVRRPRFPRILLSGFDPDPAAEDESTRSLSPGHPPISQNEQDLRLNVWWINTSHPYAAEALRNGGPNGRAWKEYHFFMFRDVVQIEHLRMLQRRDAEMALDQLENELLQSSSDFLSKITQELAEFILED